MILADRKGGQSSKSTAMVKRRTKLQPNRPDHLKPRSGEEQGCVKLTGDNYLEKHR
jgi:hypothetical protein